jgi:hypothetical protein
MEREAANLYIKASQIAIQNGHIRYTSQIESLLAKLNDPKGLDDAFSPILSQSPSLDPDLLLSGSTGLRSGFKLIRRSPGGYIL